jgi:transposase
MSYTIIFLGEEDHTPRKQNVSIHSIKTYHEISEVKSSLQDKIFKMLFHYQQGLNIRQVAQRLNIDKSCASARLNEIRKYETIKYQGKEYKVVALHAGKDAVTMKTVTYWGVKLKHDYLLDLFN